MLVLLATASRAANYDINVAGVEVSTSNYNNVRGGDIKSGTVTYSPSTKTLTLTNVSISRDGGNEYCIHNRSVKGLIVKFVGSCYLYSKKARVIRFQSGGNNDSGNDCELVATSGSTVTLESEEDGAIYVRDFTTLWIKGPGTFNITGNKNGAIAGHGSWNSSVGDLATADNIKFSDVTATVTGAQSALLGLSMVYFYAGSNVTFEATNNSSYPVARDVSYCNLYGNTAIILPVGASFSESSKSFVLNGSKIYNQDVVVSESGGVVLNSTNFPDTNFRNYLLSLYPKGYITKTELQNLTTLNVANKSISNMKGIEKLIYLKELRCWNNSFTSLNLNSNTALTYLDCAPNSQLTSLSIGSCTNLETLTCYNTGITSLFLNNLSNLKSLSCYSTKLTDLWVFNKPQLTSIDCHNCTSLTELNCNSNALTTLNVTGNTALTYLTCFSNSNLSSITGLADCTAIYVLDCHSCALTDLSAANSLTNLKTLYCYYNKLTSLTLNNKSKLSSLDCSNNTLMTLLECYSNALTSLTVTGNTALKTLRCYNNSNLSSITGLADCTAMTLLNCHDCAITDLSVVNSFTNLTELYCYNNLLGSLTLNYKNKLTTVYAYDNKWMTEASITSTAVKSLNLSGCKALKTLRCCFNPSLTSLNVTGNTAMNYLDCNPCDNLSSISGLSSCTSLATLICSFCAFTDLSAVNSLPNLVELYCNNNKLTSLTLTNKSKLTTVYAIKNTTMTSASINNNSALTSLDITGCTALQSLYCQANNLSSLSLTGCTALQTLSCEGNKLTSLDVSAQTNLINLHCYSNQLTALNVNNNTNLKYLYCYNNQLTALNVSSKTNLLRVDCYSNMLTSLNVQGCSKLETLNCYNNKLTSLYLQGCTALSLIDCYKNQITGSGMTTLVGSLPTRSASSRGTLNAVYSTDEGNSMTASQITTAQSKYWSPRKYNGSSWVEMTATIAGDVDGDGQVKIGDVTVLIDLLLRGTSSVSDYPAADVDVDGIINIADLTTLINLLLSGD